MWRKAGHSTMVAVLAPAILLGITGCKKEAPAALPPPVVQVADLATTNAPMATEIIGQLDSPQTVEVRARVEAFVESFLFTEGTEIKAGAPLFLLDKKPFEERLAAANGMLAEAKAALNKYEKDVARLSPLAERSGRFRNRIWTMPSRPSKSAKRACSRQRRASNPPRWTSAIATFVRRSLG